VCLRFCLIKFKQPDDSLGHLTGLVGKTLSFFLFLPCKPKTILTLLTPYLSKKAHFGSGRWKNFKSGNHPFKLSFLPLDAPSSELPFDITRILVGLEMIDCAVQSKRRRLCHCRLFFIP
jgi:hypothetical protein